MKHLRFYTPEVYDPDMGKKLFLETIYKVGEHDNQINHVKRIYLFGLVENITTVGYAPRNFFILFDFSRNWRSTT